MNKEKIKYEKLIKLWVKTLWVFLLIIMILTSIFFIKIIFFNTQSFEKNFYSLKEWIVNYFDFKVSDKSRCEDLNESDVTKLNKSLRIFWYAGNDNYWCSINVLKINNASNSVTRGTSKYKVDDFTLIPEIFKLDNLYELDLHSINNLKESDFDNLSSLQNLVSINISSDESGLNIPDGIYKLKNLKYLTLFWKWITWELSNEIWNLEKLKSLSIINTNIWWDLPENFFTLKHLNYLYLMTNNFTWNSKEILEKISNIKQFLITKNNFNWLFPGKISEIQSFTK